MLPIYQPTVTMPSHLPCVLLPSSVHFAGLGCPLRSRVIPLSGKNMPLRVRQNFVQTVPPLFCFQAIVPCIRLIRRAEMRQQMFKYESYTIRSGLFHHLQHQSPPVISPSISSSHNHNHPTVILQYTSWSRSCK